MATNYNVTELFIPNWGNHILIGVDFCFIKLINFSFIIEFK